MADRWQYTKNMRKSASFMGNWQIESGASAIRGRGFDSLHPLQSASLNCKRLHELKACRQPLPDSWGRNFANHHVLGGRMADVIFPLRVKRGSCRVTSPDPRACATRTIAGLVLSHGPQGLTRRPEPVRPLRSVSRFAGFATKLSRETGRGIAGRARHRMPASLRWPTLSIIVVRFPLASKMLLTELPSGSLAAAR